eukprot:NODE_13358_length_1170_cov_5.999041.p1 GENE.NODE_13358_length_1170_cov_5.999041~~NODE_13358_length_1170_cov_5.999041.p1  ORF type:complete len:287 (+),score=66.79 NODE_13358_length_1170_cov_5.999041:73-933(+)
MPAAALALARPRSCGLLAATACLAAVIGRASADIVEGCWSDARRQAACCAQGHYANWQGRDCFDCYHTYNVCCLGEESPFVNWPVDYALVGFCHSGTSSLYHNLEVVWLDSVLCAYSKVDERRSGLCLQVAPPPGMSVKHWWRICVGNYDMTPYFHNALHRLLDIVDHNRSRIVTLSLESLEDNNHRFYSALFRVLRLRQQPRSWRARVWHSRRKAGECVDRPDALLSVTTGMHTRSGHNVSGADTLYARLVRVGVYNYLARALLSFAPPSLPLPAYWLKHLHSGP